MALDGTGHFLFVLDPTNTSIWMLRLNSDGTLANTPSSPFPIQPTGILEPVPNCLAADRSGEYLFVGYRAAGAPGPGDVLQIKIDTTVTTDPQLQMFTSIRTDSTPVDLYVDSQNYLYVATADGTTIYPVTLFPFGANVVGSGHSNMRGITVDQQGRYLFEGWGSSQGFLDSVQVGAGAAANISAPVLLGSNNLPSVMLLDASANFLCVYLAGLGGAYAFPIDQSGVIGSQGALQAISFVPGNAISDPLGEFVYALQTDGIHIFSIDLKDGTLLPKPTALLPDSVIGAVGIAISSAAGMQPISGPAVQLSPHVLDYGSVTVGQPSPLAVSIANAGTTPLNLQGFTVMGASAGDFVTNSICVPPLQLPPNQGGNGVCKVTVIFTPSAAGPRQAVLTFTDDAPGSPQSVVLTGLGVAPQPALALQPGSISFGSVDQGKTSSLQLLTLTNVGTVPLHISSITLDPKSQNPFDFAIISNNCNGPVAANAACSINTNFAPLGSGSRIASITIVDDAPGSPHAVSLSGTGTGAPVTHPAISFGPTSISFSATNQNASSAPQTLTITNSGTGTLHLTAPITLGGSNPTDFALNNNCTAPAYVPGATCTLSLTFTPRGVGPRSASLAITDDAPNSPQTIQIGGLANAVDQPISAPSISNVTGATPLSIKAGATATWNLALTPNFSGNLTFICAGAPAAATCSAPSTMKVTAATPTSAKVKITTAGPASAALITIPAIPGGPLLPTHIVRRPILQATAWPSLFVFPVLVLSLLVLPVIRGLSSGSKEKFREPKTLQSVLPAGGIRFAATAFATLIVAALSISAGCGGGTTTAQSAPITQPALTPQGTYTITVTLTAAPTNATPTNNIPPILLTLTVQ